YMAPEQIFGLPLGAAADLYALGCVLYWLLAGAPPFEEDRQGELARLHAQAAPPSLSSRAPQPIPPRLDQLVMRCLAKDPDQGPRDADELGAGPTACVDGASWSSAEAGAWWSSRESSLARPR